VAAITGALLLLSAASPGEAQVPAPPETFRSIQLTGANEVPAVTTTAEGEFLWRVTDAGIETQTVLIGADFTMAHFHLGKAGTNGPVVAFLFDPITAGQDAINATRTITAANLVGPLAGKTLDDLKKEIAAGNIYVNAHSLANPAGELRAQLPADAVPAPAATPKPPATGSGTISGTGLDTFQIGLALLGLALGTAAIAVARRRA
jgi:hypothetical protein